MRVFACFFVFFLVCSSQNIFAADAEGVDLQQSLEYAFSYSPNLQSSQEAREQATHEVRRAQAGYYPTIGIWAGGGAIQESTVDTRLTNDDEDVMGTGNMGLTFSQTLWQGGAVASNVRSREAALGARIFDVLDVSTILAYNAVSAHADLIRRKSLFSLAENNVREHEKILFLLDSRFAQGLSSKGDVEQVKSRLSRAKAMLLTHKEGLDTAKANYRRITGQYPVKNILPVLAPAQGFDSLEAVRNSCVQYNYSLQAKLAQIHALVGERDYSRSAFAPRLSLDGGPSYLNTDRGGDAHALSWTVMTNMSWNIYNGGADMAGFEIQAARVRQARKDLHAAMDTLDEQISLTDSRITISREQAVYFKEASESSNIAKMNFFLQFQAGQKDLLNVLDAETEAFSAAIEEVIKSTDVLLGQYRMHALAGTLLATLDIDSESVSLAKPVRAAIDEVSPWAFGASAKDTDGILNVKDSTLRRD